MYLSSVLILWIVRYSSTSLSWHAVLNYVTGFFHNDDGKWSVLPPGDPSMWKSPNIIFLQNIYCWQCHIQGEFQMFGNLHVLLCHIFPQFILSARWHFLVFHFSILCYTLSLLLGELFSCLLTGFCSMLIITDKLIWKLLRLITFW